jgi:Asp-tRNA(Asn)/Glu-tRNA(Gln) amidotransferase A subunit family amidase
VLLVDRVSPLDCREALVLSVSARPNPQTTGVRTNRTPGFSVCTNACALQPGHAASEREAREQARAAEQALGAGEPVGSLHGSPVTIKEPIWVKGAPATSGCRALEGFRAPDDAIAVERLRRAGAIIIGKTNVPEMQFRGLTDNEIYGLTRNPWDPSRTPGGSSGGAAASVSLGVPPLALGSDGGGSIRIPASFCGVAGLKPTRGRVPRWSESARGAHRICARPDRSLNNRCRTDAERDGRTGHGG